MLSKTIVRIQMHIYYIGTYNIIYLIEYRDIRINTITIIIMLKISKNIPAGKKFPLLSILLYLTNTYTSIYIVLIF